MKKLSGEALKTARLELLNETAETYNSSNRSIKKVYGDTTCLYTPSDKSPGCAIGRKITKTLAKQLDEFYDEGDSRVSSDKVFYLLPKELQDLGQSFLGDIQRLHDKENYWNSDGLTEAGSLEVQEIKNNIIDSLYH